MQQKLSEKTKTLQEKEALIDELVKVMEKFKSQLNIHDDLLKFTANRLYLDASSKVNGNYNSTLVKSKK